MYKYKKKCLELKKKNLSGKRKSFTTLVDIISNQWFSMLATQANKYRYETEIWENDDPIRII